MSDVKEEKKYLDARLYRLGNLLNGLHDETVTAEEFLKRIMPPEPSELPDSDTPDKATETFIEQLDNMLDHFDLLINRQHNTNIQLSKLL